MSKIQEFIDYLQFENRYSQNTLIAYNEDINKFSEFIFNEFPDTNIQNVEPYMLRAWMVNLSETGLKATSINRKITSLRSFYKYLKKQTVINKNPASLIKAMKKPTNLPVYVEEDKMQFLLNDIDFGNNYSGHLSRAIIEMLYATGMRISELTGLRNNSIDFYSMYIKVLGKRNKERIIPLTNKIVDIIKEYLIIRNQEFVENRNEIYLFLTPNGKKIYNKFVYRLVNHYLGLVTTASKKSPHVIRHSFATHMLNHGADLNSIKEILGHANLAATQIYTHNSIENLKLVYKQAHPKA